MIKQFIARTKNGVDVLADTLNSHAATHLKDTPQLLELLKEILPQHSIFKERSELEVDLGRVAGLSDLVVTNADDEIFYAKRPNREEYTRFVKNRTAIQSNFISIYLKKNQENSYDLETAYVGEITPHFPTGKEDKNEVGRNFWSNHALVFGRQEIITGTETSECPW